MRVKRLILHHYRNYPELDLDIGSDNRIFLTGNNGSGKTNLIESIYYLTLGRSFKKSEDAELIQNGEQQADIYLVYEDDISGEEHSLSCLIGKQKKMFAYDGEKVNSLTKLLGKVLTVYYDPSQVFLFKEEPSERRRLLDETLSILSREYLYAIGRYKKLLKERNAALAQMADPDIIDVLRNELIALAYRIVVDRKNIMEQISKKVQENYKVLFKEERKLSLVYTTNCPEETDQATFTKEAIQKFEANRSYENMRGQTQIGPHRDNIIAYLDGKDISGYGSQGENRIATLSLKLAIHQMTKEKLGSSPILLLDDVISDLDRKRAKALLDEVGKESQVFITGTQVPQDDNDYQIYEVKKGSIIRRNA